MTTAATTSTQQPRLQSYLTAHAQNRMGTRGIPQRAIEAVLTYGRTVFIRDAMIMVIGRKEAEHYEDEGVDLYPFEGIHVVCAPDGSSILTTYRNRDLRGLRHRRVRHRSRR